MLKLNIDIAYLDGHGEDGNVNFVQFYNIPPEDFDNPPVLLYRSVSNPLLLFNVNRLTCGHRPGHYDILERERSKV